MLSEKEVIVYEWHQGHDKGPKQKILQNFIRHHIKKRKDGSSWLAWNDKENYNLNVIMTEN